VSRSSRTTRPCTTGGPPRWPRLGQPQATADAYRLLLPLDAPVEIARLAREGLSRLDGATAQVTGAETTVPVESARGVWVASVVLNGQRTARFIVDTGSSFTIVAPGLATALGLPAAGTLGVIELQTLAGHTIGAAVVPPCRRRRAPRRPGRRPRSRSRDRRHPR